MRSRRRRADLVAGALLTILVVGALFPYAFMVTASFKDNTQLYQNYFVPTAPYHTENYATAWAQVSPYIANNLIVAAATLVGVIILSSVAAYILARYQVPGRGFLFMVLVAPMMIPGIAGLVPQFVLVKHLGLLNTRWVLIIPYIAGGLVLGTFLMRTFFAQLPEEIFEAARLDGASGPQIYWRIVLPLSGPIIGAIVMVQTDAIWNDYFWPLLTLTDNSLRTVMLGLAYFSNQYVTLWGPLFAGYVLASIPLLVIYAFTGRYLLSSAQAIVA
jgi:ABC-type glycerol-3-phosphate transport system permease component